MNNEQYNQIIDEAYESALIEYGWESLPSTPMGTWLETREHFIHKIKTDNEFSEKWGLKIEERELSDDELNIFNLFKQNPTKLITLKYKDTILESYE